MNGQSLVARAAKHAQRLDWLKAHPELLARLPGAHEDVGPAQSAALDEALKQMKFYQLYAPSSGPEATRQGIRLLVSEARGVVVPTVDPRYRHRLRR